MKRKLKKKKYVVIGGVILGLVLVGVFLLRNLLFISAQAADGILRPLLGSQKTLILESFYFNTIDKLNSLTYHQPTASTPMVPSPLQFFPNGKTEKNVDKMNLSPLVVNHSLLPISSEGIWTVIPHKLFPEEEVLVRTFIRPDPQRPYAIVSLVKMDMKKLGIGLVGGTYYPGGSRHVYGTGKIPLETQKANVLVGAFNGGFQEKDGAYGMLLDQKAYVPLRLSMPALVITATGSAQFIMYHGQPLDPTSIGVRQNGPFLVENGKITSYVEAGTDTWGRTITNSTYTWRSGLGITKVGNLIYAVGNSLVPSTLAKSLLDAGAVNAIQLDINPPWVRFIVYTPMGNGQYTSTPLLTNMLENGGYSYLHGYNKDFFYIYKK